MRLWVFGLVASLGCSSPPPAAKSRPPPLVMAAPASARDVPVVVRAPVDVRPITQADVGSKTVGYLDAVLVDRGDVVRKGQLLAVVRPSELPDQLTAARSAVSQATASAALAKANLERAQALAPRGLVSQAELQNATNAAAASEAQLAASQAQLGVYATRLGETRLEAPFDGVIVARRLDPGALVGAGTGAIVSVARLDTVRVFVSVNERAAPRLKLGQLARLTFDALPGKEFEATVQRLAPSFDPLTRTLDAELQLPNADRLLRPGMYGEAALELARHMGAVVVPAEAVQVSNGKAFVFVVEGDVVRRRAVVLGEDLGEELELAAGLTPGTVVVQRGIDGLSDGARVRLPQLVGAPDAGPGR
jgi:RND family efflux transporter MFP subunit